MRNITTNKIFLEKCGSLGIPDFSWSKAVFLNGVGSPAGVLVALADVWNGEFGGVLPTTVWGWGVGVNSGSVIVFSPISNLISS